MRTRQFAILIMNLIIVAITTRAAQALVLSGQVTTCLRDRNGFCVPGPIMIGCQGATIKITGYNGPKNVAVNATLATDSSGNYSLANLASPSSSDGFYAAGSTVQLTATANSGFSFTGWSGDLTGTANPRGLKVSAPMTVTANFAIVPGVSISSLNPTKATAGGPPFTLTVTGSNFTSGGCKVYWNGIAQPTTFVIHSQVTTSIDAMSIAFPGTAVVTVVDAWGSASNSLFFTVDPPSSPIPLIAGISPASAVVGGPAFDLQVYGSNFLPDSTVRWNGSNRATTFVSGNEVRASIPASDIAAAGIFTVTVTNPASSPSSQAAEGPGDAASTPMGLSTVTNPAPAIDRFDPASMTAGSPAITLFIEGSGFVQNASYVDWKNTKILAKFISGTRISVDVPAGDMASETTINFVAINPPPGGGISESHTFTVTTSKPVLTELYYPRLLSTIGGSAGNENTGIAIANLSGRDATLTIRAFDRQGEEIAGSGITNPVSLTLSGVEQRAVTDSQLFGPGMPEKNTVGWVKLQSSDPKIAGFFLVFDDKLSTLDGADVSSSTLASFIFPEIEDQGFSQFHVANPNFTSATVTFELYKSNGSLRASPIARNINADGAIAEFFTELFPGVTPDASDYIRVTSDRGVVPFSYLGRKGRDA